MVAGSAVGLIALYGASSLVKNKPARLVLLPLRLLRRPPQLLLLIRGVLSLVVTMTGVAAPTTNLRSKPVSFSE